ncbi:Uncharacterised protein [Mycobacteroides abscessus subsp. abscessus]|nr:Uncharacterised protein [Mycobacteroides abscessus subsp. abscessus]
MSTPSSSRLTSSRLASSRLPSRLSSPEPDDDMVRTVGRLSPTNATPAFASAAITLARRRRPTSNCLPGRVRATMRTLTRSTSMLSTPISDGASSSSCERSRSTSAC